MHIPVHLYTHIHTHTYIYIYIYTLSIYYIIFIYAYPLAVDYQTTHSKSTYLTAKRTYTKMHHKKSGYTQQLEYTPPKTKPKNRKET